MYMYYNSIVRFTLPRSNFTSITTPPTPLYKCSTSGDLLIFGLVFMTEEGVLDANSLISAIMDDQQSSMSGYSFTAQMITQTLLLSTAPPVMTPTTNTTTNTPDSTDTNPGLTTDQIIGLAVGIVAAFILVLVLTTIIIVLW